jgi:type VI secretion system protein ImpH
MSTASRRKSTSVIKNLTESPHDFSFQQAVRLLERSTALRITQVEKATNKPIARYMPPSLEFVRFNANQSLAFPASDIAGVKPTFKDAKINQWRMDVNFIGLTGSNSILPYHYTETVLQRLKAKDSSMADFFNIFNHRTTSLFYQASSKYHFPIEYERKRLKPSPTEENDNYTQALLSLIGFGTRHNSDRLHTRDESIIYYAGLFTKKVRSASGLKQILQNHFNIPVEIKEFIGQWQNLIDDVRTRLPGIHNEGQNNCLGRSVMLGKNGWFAQGKFRIILGPLNKSQLHKFAPGTNALRALNEIVRLYIGIEYDYDFIMRLNKRDMPERVRLSGSSPAIIGWNTWLSSKSWKTASQGDTVDIPVSSRRFR